jgi:hypothetical protein
MGRSDYAPHAGGWMSTSEYNEMRELVGISGPPPEPSPPRPFDIENMKKEEAEGRAQVIAFIRQFGKENKLEMSLCSLSSVDVFARTFRKDFAYGCSVYGRWRTGEYGRSICSITRYTIFIDDAVKRRKWSLKILD